MKAFDGYFDLSSPVYFLGTDPDRASEAANLAADFGISLQLLYPKERTRIIRARAAIIDLDYLCLDAAGLRREVAALLSAPPARPLVLLGYQGDEAMDEPAPAGIAWFHSLSEDLFDWLAGQLAPAPSTSRFRVRDTKTNAA